MHLTPRLLNFTQWIVVTVANIDQATIPGITALRIPLIKVWDNLAALKTSVILRLLLPPTETSFSIKVKVQLPQFWKGKGFVPQFPREGFASKAVEHTMEVMVLLLSRDAKIVDSSFVNLKYRWLPRISSSSTLGSKSSMASSKGSNKTPALSLNVCLYDDMALASMSRTSSTIGLVSILTCVYHNSLARIITCDLSGATFMTKGSTCFTKEGDSFIDIKAATKNKVPLVRSLTLNWLTVCIETSSKAIILKAHKEYVPNCMECLSDGTPEVRDAAFSALSAIAKLVGMRPLEKSIEKLDDVRRKKLSEMIAGASESDVAVPSSGAIVPSSTAADGSFVRRSATSMLNGKKAVQAAPINKKVVPAKPGAAKKGNGGGQLKLSKSVDVEDPEDMSLEQIESRIGSLIQPDTISMLKSAAWKERVEGPAAHY
ncbi:unnamed protein product [Cuscuta campestris]|uniref:TOG domain-containing protein n=1 Tax=Cuscuta campestris TaxID=132261 RepID=A0A484MFS0_9ASTE|nr:unnamed protein product [Cuscuta campestris]